MWFWFFWASLAFNILCLFYVRWLLRTIAAINEDIANLNTLISAFSRHTQSVFELEMFYGDSTLKSLMDHASELSEKLEDLDLVLNEERDEIAEEETQEN